MSYSTVVWLPNALIMTALLAAVAVWRWRTKGVLSGLRWTGVAMLPLALYAIGLFRLLWTVGLAVSRFLTGFAFRPSVWVGLVLLLVAAALIVVPARLRGGSPESAPRTAKAAPPTAAKADDDDLGDIDDIDDILKRHGIA